MSIGGKSIGGDITIQINTPNGILAITPDLIGSFEADSRSDEKTWLPITGLEEFAIIPMSWGGTIELIRKSPIIDIYWGLFEAGFYNGVTIQDNTILQTIREPDGSTTQWMYLATVFKYTKAGQWRGNEFVNQTLEFRATRRIQQQ